MGKRDSTPHRAPHRSAPSRRHKPLAAAARPFALMLLGFILGFALPGFAAGSAGRSRSVLANAPELEKRVTYSETKIPLGELVAKVAADTGVPLTAARDVADEPVAVVVTDFPARELLEQLADLLDYRWSRRTGVRGRGLGIGKGADNTSSRSAQSEMSSPTPNLQPPTPIFEIYQDLASRQREEALRQALRGGVEQRFQENMAVYRELAGKSQEEMRGLWDEADRWEQRLAKLTPEERRALETSPEFRRQDLRLMRARYLWSPIRRSLAGLMTRLSPEQWAALRAGRQLVFSSHAQPGKLPLPAEMLRVFRTSPANVTPPGQSVSAETESEESVRQRREMEERWEQAEHYDVILRLLAFEAAWWDPGWIQFAAFTQPFRGGRRLGPESEGANPNLYVSISPDLRVPGTEEDAERRARLEQDPVLSAKKPFRPATGPYVDPVFSGTTRTSPLLPEIFPELARAYGVQFIADSYWAAAWRVWWLSGRLSSAGPRPLFEVLESLTHSGSRDRSAPFVWDRQDGGGGAAGPGPGLIRIRDRTWFLDRPREIPLRTVRRWVALTDRRGALPLEEFVSAATTLTDLQVDTLAMFFQTGVFPPQLNDLRSLSGSLALLRLYGRLSPAQRQALQAGRPLATAQLPPALQPLVLAHLKRANRGRLPLPDFEKWRGGYLTLSSTPEVRIREQRGRSVTWRLASAPVPRAGTPPDAVTRFPVTRLRMEVHYGGQAPAAVGLIVAADAARPE